MLNLVYVLATAAIDATNEAAVNAARLLALAVVGTAISAIFLVVIASTIAGTGHGEAGADD